MALTGTNMDENDTPSPDDTDEAVAQSVKRPKDHRSGHDQPALKLDLDSEYGQPTADAAPDASAASEEAESDTTVGPISRVQDKTSHEVVKARPEIIVSAEDSIRPGNEIFMELADKNGLPTPKTLDIVSGANPLDTRIYQLFPNGVAVAIASAGQNSFKKTPSNRDGVLVHYDPEYNRLRVMLARGPQDHLKAADIATAAVVRAALEDVNRPDKSIIDVAKDVNSNVGTVKEESGIATKKHEVILAELEHVKDGPPTLSTINFGTSRCIVINPDTTEFRESVPSIPRNELADLYYKISELYSKQLGKADEAPGSLRISEKAGQESHAVRLTGMVINFLEKNARLLNKDQADLMRRYVKGHLTMESPTDEQALQALLGFFEEAQKIEVQPGEIVVIVNNELVQSFSEGGKRKMPLSWLTNAIITGIHTQDKGLAGACEDAIAAAAELQKNDAIPDTSLSVIAFEVPDKIPKKPLEGKTSN